jgi:hypothetical protein
MLKRKKINGARLDVSWGLQLIAACGTLTPTEVVPAVVATPVSTTSTLV